MAYYSHHLPRNKRASIQDQIAQAGRAANQAVANQINSMNSALLPLGRQATSIVGTDYRLNDAMVGGGLGLGLGGLVGGLKEHFSDNPEKDYLRSILLGGGIGGLAGAGLGAAYGQMTGADRKRQALLGLVDTLMNDPRNPNTPEMNQAARGLVEAELLGANLRPGAQSLADARGIQNMPLQR